MANDINLKVGMDGEKELKKGIADINRQLKTLDLELKKATAEFESNADSQEALDAKSDILNRTLQEPPTGRSSAGSDVSGAAISTPYCSLESAH